MTYEEEYELIKERFEDLSMNVEDLVEIKNKTLDNTLCEQLPLQLSWGRLEAKIGWLFSAAKTDSESEFGRAYTNAISDAYKSVSSTDAKHIAAHDTNYIDAKKFENKVYKLKMDIETVVEVIESRKYILKDMTASIIHECKKTIL